MKKVLDKKSFIEDVNNIASTQYKLVSDNSNTKKDIGSCIASQNSKNV